VSTITGSKIYNFIPEKYKIGCVVAGFEPIDIMQSIYMLVNQINSGNQKVEIQYSRAVTVDGNVKAQNLMYDVFETRDDTWRGMGLIPLSGLKLKEKYVGFDAEQEFDISVENKKENHACICGDILRGFKTPADCKLFRAICSPENPIGACMVSGEGACQAFYKFSNHE